MLLVTCCICLSAWEGPPDPNKTVFVRHSSTVVCTAKNPHAMSIEPRDEFNNVCQFRKEDAPTQGYTVVIKQVRNVSIVCFSGGSCTSW